MPNNLPHENCSRGCDRCGNSCDRSPGHPGDHACATHAPN